MSIVKYQHIIQEINEKLFEIVFKIKCFNKVGDFDINRYAETYFMKILNLIHKSENWKLNKAIKINQDTYDLLDTHNKICVQITSRSDKPKKRKTIEMFKRKGHSKNFEKLFILYLSDKKPNSKGIEIDFEFDDMNIIDLVKLIESKCKDHELLELRDLLRPNNLIKSNVKFKQTELKRTESEEEFKRRIRLEEELKRELVIENYYSKFGHDVLIKSPYKKFKRSRFILRSYEDETYPEVNDLSQWNRTYMYDFYDRGILIWDDAITGTTARRNIKTEEWFLESYLESKEQLNNNEERLCIKTLGLLPYSHIIYWKNGDEYYDDYHLYCKYYGILNSPFEGIEYRYGEEWDGKFLSELSKSKQIKKANA